MGTTPRTFLVIVWYPLSLRHRLVEAMHKNAAKQASRRLLLPRLVPSLRFSFPSVSFPSFDLFDTNYNIPTLSYRVFLLFMQFHHTKQSSRDRVDKRKTLHVPDGVRLCLVLFVRLDRQIVTY